MADGISYSRNLIDDWLKVADSDTADSFFEFFCRFVTLNHLYFPFASKQHYDKNRGRYVENGERRGLEEFLKRSLRQLPRFEIPSELDELYEPVQDVKSVRQGGIEAGRLTEGGENKAVGYAEKMSGLGSQDERHDWLVIMLFLRVYQVRCNLFHGEKNRGKPRDVKLVAESALILKAFLQWFLRYGPSEYIFTVSDSDGRCEGEEQ